MLLRRSDGWRELTVYKGSLPELTLPDGGTVCQSMAIARWAARMAGAPLYPDAPDAALRVDEIMTFQEEVMEKAQPVPAPEDVKAFREMFRSPRGFLGRTAAFLESRAKEDSSGPFFFVARITVVDLCATGLVKMITDGEFTHIPPEWMTENFPHLTAMAEATQASQLARDYRAAYGADP